MSNRITYYAQAAIWIAQADGNLDEVSDELFRFARALDGNDELRSALTDQRIDASRRQQIVEDLLGGRASATTVGLVSMMVGTGRAGDISKIADGADIEPIDVRELRLLEGQGALAFRYRKHDVDETISLTVTQARYHVQEMLATVVSNVNDCYY